MMFCWIHSSRLSACRLGNFQNDKRLMLVNKVIHKSQNALSVYSSCGAREASTSGGEMRKNELLVDCGTDQEECVVGRYISNFILLSLNVFLKIINFMAFSMEFILTDGLINANL